MEYGPLLPFNIEYVTSHSQTQLFHMSIIVKKSIWVVVFIAVILMTAILYSRRVEAQNGERKLVAILNGDPKPDIQSIEVLYQQRRLICSDRGVISYLKQMMLSHPNTMPDSCGASYEGHFTFRDGGTFVGYLGVSTNGFTISIPSQAAEESFPTHYVFLRPPVPEKVSQIFQFFDEPYQKVAGTVLIVKDGTNIERQYDASLVAR
jgi:hypothetical protein